MTKFEEIKEAFNNVLTGCYTNKDVDIILENKEGIYTYEASMNCEDCLSEGRNGYDIVDRLAKSDRARKSYEEDFFYFREGTLIDILNDEADCSGGGFPVDLRKADGHGRAVAFEGKDLCDRHGDMYTLISGRYVSKFCITGNQVEELKAGIEFDVFDIVDGRVKTLKYKYEDMEVDFNDELNYEKYYEVEDKYVEG